MDSDFFDEGDSAAYLPLVCGDAAEALMKFETLVENEFRPGMRPPTRRSIATRLERQHRMHPAIATLVSRSFYKGGLGTDQAALRRFREELPPFSIVNSKKLPESAIVLVDMPFVQSTVGRREIERKPRYHNPEEVEAVLDVLRLLRARHVSKTSLAVLSPYREQVRRLRDRIRAESTGSLAHLADFAFEGGTDSPTGTVDSFQGSEADVVVLSLVRNNGRSGLRGLGFLADERRMNVLLSRARWKLVLVGSLQFLQSRIQSDSAPPEQLRFLVRTLETLSTLRSERDHRGFPLVSVVPYRQLKS